MYVPVRTSSAALKACLLMIPGVYICMYVYIYAGMCVYIPVKTSLAALMASLANDTWCVCMYVCMYVCIYVCVYTYRSKPAWQLVWHLLLVIPGHPSSLNFSDHLLSLKFFSCCHLRCHACVSLPPTGNVLEVCMCVVYVCIYIYIHMRDIYIYIYIYIYMRCV
jgi:hypothetical protein